MLTTVNSVEGLKTALATAHGGDTIQLTAGDYATFNLKNLNFHGVGVTITSKDPSAQATLTGFQISGSSGLTFSNLQLYVDPAKGDNPFQLWWSKNITLDHLNVHGSLDGNGQNDQNGLLIDHSTNVTVKDSEFHDLQNAISHVSSDHLTITGNSFRDIRTDGVHGAGSSFVTISQNTFTDFNPIAGDHPDAIQFFTAGTTVAAHDITITDNVVMRGGGAAIQGVFMRDEVGGLAYQNVRIDGNLVVGALTNGIGIAGATNVSITNNVVEALTDQKSGITVGDVIGGTLSGNQSTLYTLKGNTAVTQTGDLTIAAAADGGQQVLLAWAAAHPEATSAAIKAVLAGNSATLAVQRIESTRLETVTVSGGDGADILAANATRDTIVNGGAGNDTIYGGGVGHHTLIGGTGNDTYVVSSEFDNVVEEAGGGVDTVSSTIDYTLTDNVENLRLTGAGAEAVGNMLDNKISGSTGGDQIFGLGGADELKGGDGDDHLVGGDGADVLVGDAGDDTLSGDAGADGLNGKAGNDLLLGGDGNDTLVGEVGKDTLSGGAANDVVTGGEGNDSVAGGAGADTISGDAGADTLAGGSGADQFVFRAGDLTLGSPDRIVDFSQGDGDVISLKALDANTVKAGDQAFTFIGNQAFHRIAGEFRYEAAGGGVQRLMGDTNGDGAADFTIDVVGSTLFKVGDFLL